MKKNILKIVFFGSIFLFIVYLLQFALDYCYKLRVNNKISLIFKHQLDYEIMIFGSSIVYEGFNPNVIRDISHYSTYNMGLDGTMFIQYNSLIREFLKYNKKCKYLVIAFDIYNLSNNKLITAPHLYLPFLSNENVYHSLSMIEPEKVWKAKYLPGYKMTLLTKSFYYKILLGANESKKLLGYGPQTRIWIKTDTDKQVTRDYSEDVFQEMKTTINEIVQHNIKVVFVMAPMQTKGYKLINNAEIIKSKYKSLVGNNIYFIDYTLDTICNNKTFFNDYSHLNEYGSNIFSEKFANDLMNIVK